MMEIVNQQPVIAAVVGSQIQSKQPAKGAKRHHIKGGNKTTTTSSSVLRLPAVSFKSVDGFLHRCRRLDCDCPHARMSVSAVAWPQTFQTLSHSRVLVGGSCLSANADQGLNHRHRYTLI
jgi:hypothetical protein